MNKVDIDKIFKINNTESFENIVLEVFRYQASACNIYASFLEHLNVNAAKVQIITEIPFLPIEFFKSQKIYAHHAPHKQIFTSSSTTGTGISSHLVADLGIYEQSFTQAFEHIYGQPEQYCIVGLLPNYLERTGSSLVHMVEKLQAMSQNTDSKMYLYDMHALQNIILKNEANGIKTMLIGVTYALLDFAEQYPIPLKNTIIMETGGMKGQRKEMLRTEVHEVLKQAFGLPHIHSEYGMTELLSQAYCTKNERFICPSWMKILIRDTNDALSLLPYNKTGGINVIDLANVYSCSFIATQDLGKSHEDGTFEVLGRFDHSDVRGCNLMVN